MTSLWKPPRIDSEELSYEMIRPKSYFDDLDWSDRGIQFSSNRPVASAAKDAKNQQAEKPATPPGVERKKEAPQKTQGTNAAKSPRVDIDVIGDSESQGLKPTEDLQRSANFGAAGGPTDARKQTRSKDRADQSENDIQNENQNEIAGEPRSIEEWRQLFIQQPSLETAQRFSTAFKSGRVSSGEYFQVASEFLTSQDSRFSVLGSYLFRSETSLESFSALVALQKNITDESARQDFHSKHLAWYSNEQNFGVLASALEVPNRDVVIEATAAILEAAQRAGGSSGNVRAFRSEASIGSDPQAFQAFVARLQLLAESDDGEVVQKAAEALAQIQTLT